MLTSVLVTGGGVFGASRVVVSKATLVVIDACGVTVVTVMSESCFVAVWSVSFGSFGKMVLVVTAAEPVGGTVTVYCVVMETVKRGVEIGRASWTVSVDVAGSGVMVCTIVWTSVLISVVTSGCFVAIGAEDGELTHSVLPLTATPLMTSSVRTSNHLLAMCIPPQRARSATSRTIAAYSKPRCQTETSILRRVLRFAGRSRSSHASG